MRTTGARVVPEEDGDADEERAADGDDDGEGEGLLPTDRVGEGAAVGVVDGAADALSSGSGRTMACPAAGPAVSTTPSSTARTSAANRRTEGSTRAQ